MNVWNKNFVTIRIFVDFGGWMFLNLREAPINNCLGGALWEGNSFGCGVVGGSDDTLGKSRKWATVMKRLGDLEVLLCWYSGRHQTLSDIWETFSFLDIGFPFRKMRIHLFWKVVEQWAYYGNIGTFITR